MFEELCAKAFPGQECMVRRSVFQLTPVKQLVGVLKCENWECTKRQHEEERDDEDEDDGGGAARGGAEAG
eukprot:1119624-Pyramimonas_sp.AAC.1